jgi:hypothetical protein
VRAPLDHWRVLDAIHLATFVLARRELEGLELVTVDERLLAAVAGHGDAGAEHPWRDE